MAFSGRRSCAYVLLLSGGDRRLPEREALSVTRSPLRAFPLRVHCDVAALPALGLSPPEGGRKGAWGAVADAVCAVPAAVLAVVMSCLTEAAGANAPVTVSAAKVRKAPVSFRVIRRESRLGAVTVAIRPVASSARGAVSFVPQHRYFSTLK